MLLPLLPFPFLLLPLSTTAPGWAYHIASVERAYFRQSTLQCNFAFNTFFLCLLLCAAACNVCWQRCRLLIASSQRRGQIIANKAAHSGRAKVAASQQQQQQTQPSENHCAFPRLVTKALAPKLARIYRISITRQSSANPRAVVAASSSPSPGPLSPVPLCACLTVQLSSCPSSDLCLAQFTCGHAVNQLERR